MNINATTLFLLPFIIKDKFLINNKWYIKSYNICLDFPWLENKVMLLYKLDSYYAINCITDYLLKEPNYYKSYSIRINNKWYSLAIFSIIPRSNASILKSVGNGVFNPDAFKKILKFWKDDKRFNIEDYIFNTEFNKEIEDVIPLFDDISCNEEDITIEE